ncbi:MAG: hypothetical protein P8181_03330 [bacterium]
MMKRFPSRVIAVPLILGLVLTVSQCSDDALAPFQPEVSAATDNFQLQATGVTNRTATLSYVWTNTGGQAKVDHSTTTTFGSARVIIEDAGNAIVYDEALVPSLNDTTASGVSGSWTIRLVLSHYTGTVNFRVQKL